MKRIFSAAVLTLCSVFLFSSMANAACSPVDCAALGYTKTEVACNGSSTIRCPFDVTKVNCVEKALNCSVGDIYYSDGTCDASVVSGKTPVGVVGYLTDGGKHGAVIALEEKTLVWSNLYNNLSCPDLDRNGAMVDMNGKSNTACIMAQPTDTFPAAAYCDGYVAISTGIGSKSWYLPAAGEIHSLGYNYGVINSNLSKLSKTQLSSNWYWSSSEHAYNSSVAWSARPSDGGLDNNSVRKKSLLVRCMLEF